MKQSTTFASVANKFSKVLQGYTKGIRFVAVLTLLLTMGIGQAWGATKTGHNINYPYFYYYNDASWSNVSVIFGRSWSNDNYTKAGPMTLVQNTEKLYFRYIEDNWNNEYNQIAVLHGSWEWPSGENKNIESRWNYATNQQHTDDIIWNHDMDYHEVHYWGGKSANSISIEVPKYTTTLNIKVKESGQATYSNATLSDKPASTIKLTGTYLSSAGKTTRSEAAWTTNSSCQYESVISGKVTPAYDGLNTDWTFDGWYVDSKIISSDKNYDFYQTANTTIEARFTKTVKYTVTWKVNGGQWSDGTTDDIKHDYTVGATITPPADPTRTNHTFAGWDPEIPATMPAEDLTFTAIWENCRWVETDIDDILPDDEVVVVMKTPLGFFTLDHSKGTGDYPPALPLEVNGNEIDVNSTYYKNSFWNISGNATDGYVLYPNGQTETWLYCTKSNYNVRVGTNGNKIFTIEDGYLKHTNLEETWIGYIGVYYSKEWRHYPANTGNAIAGQTLKFYKRVCLEETQHWVTWNANGGQFNDGSTTQTGFFTVGDPIAHPTPTPTREGHTFTGWNPAPSTMPDEDITLEAQWQVNSYTVTWNANGGQFADGKTIIEETYEYGATITKPDDPTLTGYTFKGWSPNVPDKMSTEAMTFVAQWQVNQYTVTWNPGEGGHWGSSFEPIVENYNYGAPINKPANPQKAGYVFDKWEPDVVATMPNNNLIYTAKWNESYCDAFTFHTGDADVWNKPQQQICFEYKDNHEWQIINYVIPTSDAQSHFLVADKGWPQRDQGTLGGHSKSATSTWSATMYLAPSMDSNNGNGSPKVGHAKGAVGTLRIFDDSNWDNLYVGFIPNGYKLKFGANEYDFIHHENAEYRSEIVEYNATTANNNVSVGIINTTNNYVKTDHTQEGMRHVFLKVNENWKNDDAKFAIYYFNSNNDTGWSNFMKEVPGETDLYEGWIPNNYSKIIFVRLNPDGGINWGAKWNQTGNLTLNNDNTLYTIPSGSWDDADNTNWSTYKRKGKFRIYNNYWDKNWYVHFYPHYVITFDKNAADATGTMSPQALPLDANPMTIVLNECAFERRGYDFTGWKTDVDITADGANVAANGNVKDKATISNINQDITLKAQWEAQSYTITYKDQGDAAYSGENSASLPTTHTYDQTTTLVAGEKTGYTFGGWYTTPDCDGAAITELGAQDYTTDTTLYAKWTFAMEYNITNTETIFVTSAKGQTIKATTQLSLQVSNMPVGTTIDLSATNIKFYFGDEEIKRLTNKYVSEPFLLTLAYTPTEDNTTEQPTITLSVLGNEKTFDGLISARSLPANFVIAAKWGDNWYAMPADMDSQSSTEGWLIEVDDAANPTKALAAPNTTKYGLKSVYTSNGSADRFAKNGERLVFVENITGTNKALYNGGTTSNKTSIQVYAQYANYYSDTERAPRYEWIPTTSNLQDYTLTSALTLSDDAFPRTVSLDNHGIFGTLLQDESYNGMVRLLPVDNDNFYEPIELQVVEWKQNSVSVMYTGKGAQYTTQVGDNIASGVLSESDIDQAVYSLSTASLTDATNQPLIISIKDEADAIIGAIKLTIPAIVATNKSSTTLGVTKENAKATSIVVLDGATLSADATEKYTYDDITVYPGGKLLIGKNGQLGMYSLTLRAGSSWNGDEYEHKYPQFVLNNQATGAYSNTSGQINLDYVTTKEQYYTFVAPFEVQTKDIKYPVDIYGSNVDKANPGSFEFQYYDGEARAAGSPGWKVVEEGAEGATLNAGQGYTFLGMPKKINGIRQTYGIHRIPMKVTASKAQSHENTDQTVPLSVHLSAKNNNSGWNLVGNPYMATVKGLTNNDIQVGQLVHTNDANGNWTGGWHWDDPTTGQRFLVIPSNDGQSYTAVQATNAELPAFKNFFVQISNANANAMSIPVANRVDKHLAPARNADVPSARDIELAIVLEQDEAHADQLDFLLNDLYTAAFDFNGDFTKMMNATLLNLYGVHTDDNLSFVAVDHHTARQSIPIGYQVPAAGEYTLRMSDQPYVMWDEIEALYVTDHEMSPALTTDLMSTPYTFFVHQAESNNERFSVSVQTKAKTENGATDLDNVLSEGEQIHKFIYQDKIFILHHGVVYDATGKRVITINK